MQRYGDCRRDLVAATYPCERDGKQRFQAPERRKAKKNSNGRAEGDGVRRVRDGHQRHVVRDQPALEPRQWP